MPANATQSLDPAKLNGGNPVRVTLDPDGRTLAIDALATGNIPIVSGSTYGIRVESSVSHEVLYDQGQMVDMHEHDTCFFSHPECDAVDLKLPDGQIPADAFQRAGGCP